MHTYKKICCLALAITITLSTGILSACDNSSGAISPPEIQQPLPEQAPPSQDTTQPETEMIPPQPEPEPQPVLAKYIRCTGNSVNIRSGAGTSYTVLGSAEKDTAYTIIEQTGNWYKTYYRGKIAYISASYGAVWSIEKSDNEKIERVIEEGYKLIGTPYVYGAVRLHDGNGNFLNGFSTQKFDCSSLVQYMFYKGANKLLQVTTRTQVKQGTYVKKSDIQRGDCLFFTNESRYHLSGVERVGHVAVYLGDNYILHTASDYARIEKISAKRWGYFLEARRFI